MNRALHPQMATNMRGYTLIELVVSIVVLAIAVAGILAELTATAVRSADAMISEQEVAIASSYLNEVLQKPFGANDGQIARVSFDVVGDYAGLTNVGVQDQSGAAVPGLGQYTVTVNVRPGTLGAVPVAQVAEVDITVAHPSGVTLVLSGYRTQHP